VLRDFGQWCKSRCKLKGKQQSCNNSCVKNVAADVTRNELTNNDALIAAARVFHPYISEFSPLHFPCRKRPLSNLLAVGY